MAGARRSSREPGKSDPIDALAVARAALREDLPVATLDGPDREVRLLVDHREDLVAERTRAQNRLRWHLHELDPGNEPAARASTGRSSWPPSSATSPTRPGTVARIARELVGRIRDADRARSTSSSARSARVSVAASRPSLLALTGCGPLTGGQARR